MDVIHVKEIEKIVMPGHGETSLYQQILGISTPRPGMTKAITSLWIMTIKPGGTNKRHVHEDQEQVYFVLEGEGIVEVGEERSKVKAWDVIYLPPKIPHAFYNDTEAPCLVMGISAKIPK